MHARDPEGERIHVLRVIPTIDPAVGGPSHSAINAIEAEHGGEIATSLVTSVAPDDKSRIEPKISRLSRLGIRTLAFPRSRHLLGKKGTWGLNVKLIVWLYRHVGSYDAVHFHYVWSLTTLVGSIRASELGLPVILTTHESLTSYDIDVTSGSRSKRLVKLLVRRLIMKHVSAVVCASRLELEDSLPQDGRGTVIPHPITAIEAAEDRAQSTNEGPKRLGFLGRLHPKKGLERLLYAVSGLDVPFELVVAGDGDPAYVSRLHQLSLDMGLADVVDWRGFVGPTEKARLLTELDWLIMPSDYECFGMAGGEALSAGVPVVVTPTTGLSATVEEFEAGLVAGGLDNEQLRETLQIAVQMNPDRYMQLRENALEARALSLSPEAYRKRVLALYRSLISSD